MNRELLEKPFGKSVIKKRKGRGGEVWDYVEAAHIIKRLNDSFDGNWSFEVVSHEKVDGEVIVLGKLTAEGIVKQQFGGKQVSKHKDGSLVCLADDMKAAASDALKKSATQLGVALDLYIDEAEGVTDESTEKVRDDQLAQIKQLRTSLKWDVDALQGKSRELFGQDVMSLNPVMADALIAYLKNQGNGSGAAESRI